jgi:hypothetical protein
MKEAEAKARAEAVAMKAKETEKEAAAAAAAAAERPAAPGAQSMPPDGVEENSRFRFDTAASRDTRTSVVERPWWPAGKVAGEGRADRVEEAMTEWTAEVEQRVLRQLVAAFDNYREDEVVALLRALVTAASIEGVASDEAARSLAKLAGLTVAMEGLESSAVAGVPQELFVDDVRTLHGQLRMYGKDGEKYLNRRQDGEAGNSWLGFLDELRRQI